MSSTVTHELPILRVELRARHGTRSVDLYPSSPPRFSVGSGSSCNVWLSGSSLPLVCFYLVRSGRALLLVPSEACGRLTVNAKPVLEVVELPPRAIVEFDGERVLVTTFDLSTEPQAPTAELDTSNLPTQVVTVCAVTEPIPTCTFRRRANTDPIELPRATVEPLVDTARLTAVPSAGELARAPEPTQLASSSEVITLRVPVCPDTPRSPPLRAMPVLGVGVGAALAAREPAIITSAMRDQPIATPVARAPFAPVTSRAKLAPRRQRNRLLQAVALLGTRAKAEPRRVFGAALLVALLLSVTFAGISRALTRPPAALPRPGASSSVVRAAHGVPTSRAIESAPAPAVSVRVTAAPSGDATSRRATSALGHLLAGRETDARTAYARLASELPVGNAYAAVARLLERRAGPQCSARATAEASVCPELKR